MSGNQVCTFRLGPLLLGIEVLRVQEIIRIQEMQEVPLAPEEVRGLINLRGEIVTAIDLRKTLGLAPVEGWRPNNIVVRQNGELLSLLVDQVGEVIELEASRMELPPQTLTANLRRQISGVYKLDDGLLMILNLENMLEAAA